MTLKFRNLKFGALTYQNEAGPNIQIRCFDKACPGQECVIIIIKCQQSDLIDL